MNTFLNKHNHIFSKSIFILLFLVTIPFITSKVKATLCGFECNGTLTNFSSISSQDQAPGTGWTANNKRWGSGALMLDGVDDYVNIPSNASTKFGTGNFSLEAWINTTDTEVGDAIIETAAGTGDFSVLKSLRINDPAAGGLSFYVRGSGTDNNISASVNINDGNWHYVVGVRNGTTMSLYKDGILVSSGVWDPGNTDTTTPWYFGKTFDSTARYTKLIIDSTRIYSRALTPQEILSNYNSGTAELQYRECTGSTVDTCIGQAWQQVGGTTEVSIDTFDDTANLWFWNINPAANGNGLMSSGIIATKAQDSSIKIEGTASMKLTNGITTSDGNTIGLWHLDETDRGSGTFKDSVGSSHGTPTNVAVVDGIAGKGGGFNGTSSYVNLTHNANQNALPITISAWFRSKSTGYETIVNKYVGSSTNGYHIGLTGGQIQLFYFNSSSNNITDYYSYFGSKLNDGSWHQVVATVDTTGGSVYIDGKFAGKHTWVGTPSAPTTTQFLSLGYYDASTDDYFLGAIDEVRLDNVVRTPDQIYAMYLAGASHRLSRIISSENLTGRTRLPFSVASDKAGYIGDLTIGQSGYTSYEPDSNTAGLWHLDEPDTDAARSCYTLRLAGNTTDGVYWIDPDGPGGNAPVQAYCNMTYDGGGWTMVVKSWYGANLVGKGYAVGAVADATTKKGNAYKLADITVRNIIGPSNNFDVMADQNGYNSAYSTGNFEYVVIRNYTGVWTYEKAVDASTTTTTFQSYRISDQALAWTGNLQCGDYAYYSSAGINCVTVLTNNPQGGAGCTINMGSSTNSGWHHFFMNQFNDDTYLYICNGAQHSSSYDLNHRFWIRERNPVIGKPVNAVVQVTPTPTPTPVLLTATGGTITSVNGYTAHSFTSSGTFTVTANSGTVDVLVVAGGGGGGGTGSGGGAGGYVNNTAYAVSPGAYTVTVGAAGAAGATTGSGGKGGNSVFGTITAEGGGYGVSHGGATGGTGGCGGGSSIKTSGTATAGGTGNQGGAGGAGYVEASWAGNSGGGGGAGQAGVAGGNTSGTGNGGVGRRCSASGVPVFYASGGGAGEVNGSYVGTGGGGYGGGGGNGNLNAAGSAGTANTGGGGGGGSYNAGTYTVGGAGGSGIVVLRYPNSANTNYLLNQTEYIGGAKQVEGKLGKGRYFRGSSYSDNIQLGNDASLQGLTNMTVEAWILPVTGFSTTYWGIINKHQSGLTTGTWTLRSGDASNLTKIAFTGYGTSCTSTKLYINGVLDNSGTTSVTSNMTISANMWYHVVGTMSGCTNLGTNAINVGVGYLENQSGTNSPSYFFQGTIDEVRISNIERSASDIRAAYEFGSRSHPINIEFVTSPSSAYTAAATTIALSTVANLASGDTIIIKETTSGGTNIEQRQVKSISGTTATLASGFSNSYSTNAIVTKWQKDFMDIADLSASDKNAVNRLTFQLSDNVKGATVWLDDLRVGGPYTTTSSDTLLTFSQARQYFQLRQLISSSDTGVSPAFQTIKPYGASVIETTPMPTAATRNSTCFANGTTCTENSNCCTGVCTPFYQDSDSDTYGNASVTTKKCGTTPPTGYVANNTDCDDAQGAVWVTHAACYWDLDKDTRTNGNASGKTCLDTSSCDTATKGSVGGGVTPTTYTTGQLKNTASSTDCNDNDNTRWQTLTCYYDNDADTYGTSTSASKCKGASCAAPTDGDKYNASNATDCYDSNANAYPGSTYCSETNRGDGSWDYNCNGSSSYCYFAATYLYGWCTYGHARADDPGCNGEIWECGNGITSFYGCGELGSQYVMSGCSTWWEKGSASGYQHCN